jgi:hypothetical protein
MTKELSKSVIASMLMFFLLSTMGSQAIINVHSKNGDSESSVLRGGSFGGPASIQAALGWNTFLGGLDNDYGNDVAVDGSGNVYVTGQSTPTWGSPIASYGGACVVKLDPNGNLIWNTFLGGIGEGIAVDGNGYVYVTGYSSRSWGSPKRAYGGACVAKLDNNGNLVWNTFLGGSAQDFGFDIALDGGGNVYVAGNSSGPWGAPIRPYTPGANDAFAAKLDTNGNFIWNTFLGSSIDDYGWGIAADRSGNAYVTGYSYATWGLPKRAFTAWTINAFAAKIDTNGSLTWNTFLGGGDELGEGIAVDGSGNVFVTGYSRGRWGSPIRAHGLDVDMFVAKIDSNGTLVWNTFSGGSGEDSGKAIAVDGGGNVYVTGHSYAPWGPQIGDFVGGPEAFASKLDTNGNFSWSMFLGGGSDYGLGIAVDGAGNVLLAGKSPGTWGSPIRAHTWDWDAFVAKIASDSTIAVTSPNGGESWAAGSVHNLIWKSTGTVANVKIEFTTNGGASWTTIVASAPNTGSHIWTVPNAPSVNCLVRISDAATASIFDVSNATFSIVAATLPIISLSRSQLFFGANTANLKTSAQSFLISNAGGGTLDWAVADDAAWLSCTPTSGTGNAQITVSVDATGLAVGTYTASITVSSTAATNSPQTVSVYPTVMAPGTSSAPFGYFDTPTEGAAVFGSVPVTGWALDDIEVVRVEVKRSPHPLDNPIVIGPDGLVFIGNAVFVEGARPDVANLYPTYPLNSRAGWGYMLLTNMLPNYGNGPYTLHAIAYDKEGNSVTLGSKSISCNNADSKLPFGAIDTPAPGGTASGAAYVNFGWALTPQPNFIPMDGSTINVWVDGVAIGRPVYNNYRSDIATKFPGYANSEGAVGYYYLDTTAYANAVHTNAWSVVDSGGNVTGIGSRFFTIFNSGTAMAGVQGESLGTEFAGVQGEEGNRYRVPVFQHTPPSWAHVSSLPVSFEPVVVRKGYAVEAEPEIVHPDPYGVVTVEIPEVERVEIHLGWDGSEDSAYRFQVPTGREEVKRRERLAARQDGNRTGKSGGVIYSGYLVAGDELKPLPIGSTLDTERGVFCWQPGPGFLGEYDYIFVREERSGISKRLGIKIKIIPKF